MDRKRFARYRSNMEAAFFPDAYSTTMGIGRLQGPGALA